MSLYEEIGGDAPIRKVLQALYDRLFADVMVGFLFEGKDKAHIVEQQVRFTAGFLGGPARYEGKPLPEAHASLPLLSGHFERRHHLLRLVLTEQAVPAKVADAWLRIDASLKTSVLASGEEARDEARKP